MVPSRRLIGLIGLLTFVTVAGLSAQNAVSTSLGQPGENVLAGLWQELPLPPRTTVVAIGIARYMDPSIESLADAGANAQRVFARLTERPTGLGTPSESVLMVDSAATRDAILKTFSAFAAPRSLFSDFLRQRQVIVYWSGQCAYRQNETYLIPYDASPSAVDTSGVSLTELVGLLGRNKRLFVILVLDGCQVDATFARKVQTDYPLVGVLAEARSNALRASLRPLSASVLAAALDDTIANPGSDIDRDGFVSLEEAFVGAYAPVIMRSYGLKHLALAGVSPRTLRLARTARSDRRLRFDQPLAPDLRSEKSIVINGETVAVDTQASTPNELVLLGAPEGPIARGMVLLQTARNRYRFWREEQNLQAFADPYKNSYALLIAIDDYQRRRDPQRRGSTGYESRGFMVQRAKELATVLTKLGFSPERIITLFDADATSSKIDETLQTFWPGGSRAESDRLFVYFGGHGDTFNGAGVLVTYNFQGKQPTLTGYLMRDLTTRHAENIAAHHVLFAIDACSSGLAVYKKLGGTKTPGTTFAELSVIRNDTAAKARNVLVAGTEDQPAVWDQGGIFTRSLIRGLQGAADLSQDGLIQFLELSAYVGNEVAVQASAKGVRQQVQPYTLDVLGTGNFMFLREF